MDTLAYELHHTDKISLRWVQHRLLCPKLRRRACRLIHCYRLPPSCLSCWTCRVFTWSLFRRGHDILYYTCLILARHATKAAYLQASTYLSLQLTQRNHQDAKKRRRDNMFTANENSRRPPGARMQNGKLGSRAALMNLIYAKD